MKIAAYNLNENGLVISKSKLRESLTTALARHSRFNIFLFDKCILDSPSLVDWVLIKRFLIEEYPHIYEGLKNALDGTIDFSSKRLRYAMGLENKDEILYAIEQLLLAEEEINSYNSLYEFVKFKRSCDTAIYKPNMIVTSKVVNRSKVSTNRVALLNCIEDNNILLVCDNYKIIREYICNKYNEVYKAGVSIFKENSDETLDYFYLNEFVTGKIKGDTALAEKLFKDITTYYHEHSLDYVTENSGCMKFEEHIFNDCLDAMILNQKQFRAEHPNCKTLEVENYAVFYYESCDSSSVKLPYNTFGLDCVDHYSGKTLHFKNSLCGLSGEFVSESDINRNRLTVRGIPLELFITENKIGKYYPLINVRNSNGNFLEPILNNELYYVPENYPLIDESNEVDSIVNSFLSYRSNYGNIDNFVSTRLKFSDTEILDACVSKLKGLGVL